MYSQRFLIANILENLETDSSERAVLCFRFLVNIALAVDIHAAQAMISECNLLQKGIELAVKALYNTL